MNAHESPGRMVMSEACQICPVIQLNDEPAANLSCLTLHLYIWRQDLHMMSAGSRPVQVVEYAHRVGPP